MCDGHLTTEESSGTNKSAVIISAFHYYDQRIYLVKAFLEEQGFTCTYITSDFDHISKKPFTTELGIQIPARPYYKNLSVARLLSHIKLSRDTFQKVAQLRPDLLFVMVPPNSMVREAVAYKKKHPEVKLVLDLYDLWPETFPSGKAKKLLALPFGVWGSLRDRGLKAADLVTTECALYQQVLKKQLSGCKVQTLYLCRPEVTAPETMEAPAGEWLELCYLGSINNIIDIPTIGELLRQIGQKRKVKLHIIGDGENRELLIATARDAGAQVEYHGSIYDKAEKQAIFDRCSFGINIMKSSVCVGLTMKSLDYFAGGLPILNTIGGDTWELVQQRGIGINVDHHDIGTAAAAAVSCTTEDNSTMRRNTLATFREKFSEEAFKSALAEGLRRSGL